MSNSKRGQGKGQRGGGAASRRLHTPVRTAKGRRASSTRWLQRQLNDPYVAEARARGYRSRAAFKILQIDEKVRLFRKGQVVVDLGAAPGGWAQVAVERVGNGGRVIGIDLLEMDPIPGAELLEMDFMADEAPQKLRDLLGGGADVVLSDMAPANTGHSQTDHLRIMGLAEAALEFAEEVLSPRGSFVAKVLQGGTEKELLDRLKLNFERVRHIKPPASRSDSSELYVVAQGFRGSGRSSGPN
ncbi:MAG: RlmE family RNA methyltransferase [Pseudomonadota bacterium]|uniref:RlmE family RNA methyltransferase n=1 Tax=Fodinicurvata fenggangensis TaxID=1121830 RepID=UPI00047D3BCC|nr:RlmE family RNA methyltransferase [Fodinicurvata fenggangensis]